MKGQAVLITGGGRGIGKRLAMGFAAAGARVALLARSKAELDLARLEIEHAGGNAIAVRADVRDYEHVCAAVDRMRVNFGGIDVLIASAGIQGPLGPLVEAKPKAWAETIEVNLTGAVNCCIAVLPQMIEQRHGKIILLIGGGAGDARPGFSAYASSKAALVRFAECVSEEVRDANVQINCMSPGGAYSHMTDEIIRAGARLPQKEIERAQKIRLTGGVSPEKQVQLALFLASDRSNHISGKFIHVEDDWKKLEHMTINPEAYTLRRVLKG